MKLKSPELEKRLRHLAQEEMRVDKQLWKDYRRHRASWLRRKFNVSVGQSFWYIYSAIFIAGGGMALHRRDLLLLASALYATGTVLWRSLTFHTSLVGSYERAAVLHLPVSDEDFFVFQFQKNIASWVRALCLFLIGYGVIAIGSGHFLKYIGPAIAASVLQAGSGLAVSLWLLAKVTRFKTVAAMPIYALIFSLFWLPGAVTQMIWSAVMLVPGGWIAHAFSAVLGLAPQGEVMLAFPALVVIASLPLAYVSVRNRILAELDGQVYEDLARNMSVEADAQIEEPPGRMNPLSSEAPLWQGHYLDSLDWTQAGWIESLVAKWLGPRELKIAEFLLGDQLGAWSKRWKTGALITAAGIIVIFLAPESLLPNWSFFLVAIAGTLWGMPVLGGFWQGFQGAPTSGLLIPAYAVFPIGYGEITRVMVKANLVRILCFCPLLIGQVIALAVHHGRAPIFGIEVGVKLLILIMLFQPLTVAGHISSGSNDTRVLRWRTVLFFLFALVLLAISVAAVLAFFIIDDLAAEQLMAQAGLAVVFSLCVGAICAVYGRLYNRSKFDLIATPK